MLSKITVSKCQLFLKGTRLFYCLQAFSTYDKHFDFFRNRTDYKNSVIHLSDDFQQNKVAGPGFAFMLKEHDVQTDKLFSHLLQRDYVMKLSTAQLKDILTLIANLKINTAEYASALKYLDEKCTLSAERWPLDLSLYILDAWFIILGPKAFRKHYYSVIPNLWSRKMKKCTRHNLILMLYFIGMSKSSPPFLLEILEDKMESFVNEFTDEEWAVACLSFFKISKPIISKVLLDHSCKVAENLIVKQDRFNLISILKCLRLSKHYNENLLNILTEYIIKEHEAFNFVECAHFLAVFATQTLYNRELYECLENQGMFMLATENNTFSKADPKSELKTHPSLRSRVKDIARFLWSMTTVGHTLKESSITEIITLLKYRADRGEFEKNIHILVDCLQSLIFIESFPEHFLKSVFERSFINKILNSDKAKPRYQMYFIYKCCQIESPSIISRGENIHISNPIPKNLNRDVKERKGFNILFEYLKQNSSSVIKCCYIMPHIMIAGIIVGTDINNACETPILRQQNEMHCDKFKMLIDCGILSKYVLDIFQGNRFYTCIEILDNTVCVQGTTEPLGLMKTKLRQLKKLNFHVITLTPEEINSIVLERKSEYFPKLSHLIA